MQTITKQYCKEKYWLKKINDQAAIVVVPILKAYKYSLPYTS
jgi:hypothetical protein